MPANYEILDIGTERARIVVIDDAFTNPETIVDLARSLSPFPTEQTVGYPGARLKFTPDNLPQSAYVHALVNFIYPAVAEAYGCTRLNIIEACFSIVTCPPEQLHAVQRIPHVDNTYPNMMAILHYLSPRQCPGTAFYRHRATGIEMMTPENQPVFRETVSREIAQHGLPEGYIDGSTPFFEQIAHVDGRFNRIIAYPGRQLHSGLIAPDYDFSSDPDKGRLTGNLFIDLS